MNVFLYDDELWQVDPRTGARERLVEVDPADAIVEAHAAPDGCGVLLLREIDREDCPLLEYRWEIARSDGYVAPIDLPQSTRPPEFEGWQSDCVARLTSAADELEVSLRDRSVRRVHPEPVRGPETDLRLTS